MNKKTLLLRNTSPAIPVVSFWRPYFEKHFYNLFYNQQVVDRFFPDLLIGKDAGLMHTYNSYPQKFGKEEIFKSMERYFNEVPLHLW